MRGVKLKRVILETINHDTWGKCISLSNGLVDLLVTLEFGPRIIRYGIMDQENMFWEDIEENFSLEVEYKGLGREKFVARGGHRLWVSPEKMPRTYYPDNQKIEWEQIENGIIIRSEEEIFTHIQKEIEIKMDPQSSKITVIHRITNRGAWPIKFAPWAISSMAPGGREIIPQPVRDTGLLANRVLALWPYSNMQDRRVYWGKKYIILDQDPSIEEPFKFGINSDAGWGAYFNHNCMFVKRYIPKENVEYPDFGVSYETYTNGYFLEMETLGELKVTEPGETVEHVETWELFKDVERPGRDEDQIDNLVKKYI